jgi:hypothetical protein
VTNAFITLGDTDYLSPTRKHASLDLDSTLLRVSRSTRTPNGWATVVSVGSRTPTLEKKYYSEFVIGNNAVLGGVSLGAVLAQQVTTVLLSGNLPGSSPYDIGYLPYDSVVYKNYAALASVSSSTHSDVIGMVLGTDSTLGTYVQFRKAGRRNVLGYTEDFSNAAWLKTNVTVIADAADVPPGFDPALHGKPYKLAETAANSYHYFEQSFTTTAGTHTYSVIARAGERSIIWLWATTTGNPYSTFNLATGALGANFSGPPLLSRSITSLGGGWYRCSITYTASAVAALHRVGMQTSDVGPGTYAGAVGSGAYIWGAQFEGSPEATAYQRQIGAAGGYLGPRFAMPAGAYHIGVGDYYQGSQVKIRVDRDDLEHLMEDEEPWGAAACISDADAFAPAATKLDLATRTNAGLTVDAFLRTAINPATNAWWAIRGDRFRRSGYGRDNGPQWVWAEHTLITATHLMLGLHKKDGVLNQYPGADANGWGVYPGSANSYHNGVAKALATAIPAGDRVGVLLDRWAGRLWFAHVTAAGVTTILGGGTPYPGAGTTPQYTNVIGEVTPAIGLNSVGTPVSTNILTGAREQIGRPWYADPWDGAHVATPEAWHVGRLGNDPYIEHGVWHEGLWGGGEGAAAPVGAIDLDNSEGTYDPLTYYALRDQIVAVDRVYDDGFLESEGRALISTTEYQGESVLRVVTDRILAKIAKAQSTDALIIGTPNRTPIEGVSAQDLTYKVAGSPWWTWLPGGASQRGPQDNVLSVSSFRILSKKDSYHGLKRTVAPAGKQSFKEPIGLYPITHKGYSASFPNGGFDTWAGDNPANFTVVEPGGANIITQNGASRLRFLRVAGGGTVSIQPTSMTVSPSAAPYYLFEFVVTAWVTGYLQVRFPTSGRTYVVAFDGPGTYYAPFNYALDSGAQPVFEALTHAVDATDFTLEAINLIPADDTNSLAKVADFLLGYHGGLRDYYGFLGTLQLPGTTEVGHYVADRRPLLDVLDEVLKSRFWDSFEDFQGVVRFARLEAPGTWPAAATASDYLGALSEDDLLGPMSVSDDMGPGVTDTHVDQTNYDVHADNEVAGAVTAANRQSAVRPNTEYKGFLHSFYAHGIGAPPHDHLGAFGQDMITNIYGMNRRRFATFDVDPAIIRRWHPGGQFFIKYPRFRLQNGTMMRFIRATRPTKQRRATVLAWW